MAILGFLAHAMPGEAFAIERNLKAMPALSTYGIHNNDYIVAVAEAPSQKLEGITDMVRAMDGVIAVYVTSFTIEDEDD